MKKTAAVVLSGGHGSRLFPLTLTRCKPAVHYGGHYRLIDIALSNAINSKCDNIYVVTQFLSRSLHQHISNTYQSDVFSNSIDILTVEETPKGKHWLEGTADAIRQNLDYLLETAAEYFLILSGDQLYSMDFNKIMRVAQKSNADVVVASMPVSDDSTKRLGILGIDENGAITSFVEKPQTEKQLKELALSSSHLKRLRIPEAQSQTYLGSMGIYLFKRQALINLLQKDSREDFGKHLIPTKVKEGKIVTYIHKGYWKDIGTIESFYHANMALNLKKTRLNCHDEKWRLFFHRTMLPGARISCADIDSSIICEGTSIEAKKIYHSILGPLARVLKGTTIKDSYIMGNDTPSSSASIGKNCVIQKAILDKNVHLGNDVHLINKQGLTHYDSDHVYIRDGIIVVPRGARIPNGFIL